MMNRSFLSPKVSPNYPRKDVPRGVVFPNGPSALADHSSPPKLKRGFSFQTFTVISSASSLSKEKTEEKKE
jgi:hypothetical protein